MSNQLQITGGAKVRSLEGVITGTSGVLGALGINVPSGIPQLDTNGKILVSQLPNSVMEYKGTWDASTNTPTLANGTGNQGDVYLCSAAGTVNFGAGPITFAVGDQVIYSGTIWQKAGGATGTVTSVAVTESGDALTITGSPITTSGTINIGFAGTTGQYVNGAGGLTTFPSLTGYVPYTGATTDVDLGVYVLNAQALHVKGTAGAGHLGLKHQSAAATGSANESLIYANVDGDLAWQNDNLNLTTLSTHANTANRVYTFPDLTGTMAMLEGTQTFTGFKTFSATTSLNTIYVDGLSYIKNQTSTTSYITGYTTFSAKANGIIEYYFPTAYKSILDFNDGGDYTYAFPALTGTIALLEGTQTFTGDKTFTASVNNDDGLKIKLGSASNLTAGYLTLSAYGETTPLPDRTILRIGTAATQMSLFKLQNTGSYTYDFPASSGTIALTSNLSSYVPYTGATSDVNLGTTYSLSANNITAAGVVKSDFGLQLKSGLTTTISGYLSISAQKVSTNSQLNVYTDTGFYFSLIAPNTANYSYTYPASSGTLVLGTGTTNYLPKFTGASTIGDSQIFDNGSNVGINTNNPLTLLHLGGATNKPIRIDSANGNAAYVGSYQNQTILSANRNPSTGAFTDTSKAAAFIALNANTSDGNIVFATTASNNTEPSERMRITSAGNVGIGTSSPATRFDLAGTIGNFQIAASGAEVFLTRNDNNDILATGGTSSGITIGAQSYVRFSVGTSYTERMRITSGGDVLVGWTGGTYNDPVFNNVQGISIRGISSSPSFIANSNSVAMYLGHNGNTGTLVNFNYNGSTTVGSISNNTTSVSYNTISDYRLKQDFKDYNAISLLSTIKTYDYEWKIDKTRSFGVIAHELSEIIPYAVNGEKDAVDENGNIKPQQVDYSKIVPILVKAIQELEAKVTALENKI